MRFVFTICSLSWVFFSNAGVADSIRAEQRSNGLFVIHQVEEEETLYSLAKRYGGTVHEMIVQNQITDNRINVGQMIEILVKKNTDRQTNLAENEKQPPETIAEDYHLVGKGETLYSISRRYNVKVKDLKKWNNLKENAISSGMRLKIDKTPKKPPEPEEEHVEQPVAVSQALAADDSTETLVFNDFPEDFERYLVQTSETLYTIARQIGVSLDSLRAWNSLKSDYLKIGQELWFKKPSSTDFYSIDDREKRSQAGGDGFEKIYDEGIISVIDSMNTSKYLALHRTLPIGTNIEVRNLMNNQIIQVKVVGKLPDTGINQNLMLRLSKPAYDQLGILDSRSRVEISYFKK
ncbi:MAG: LysM peptidoglycan-binding domain-containing protein [Ekhidna sp.]|nr:LysM peptidoglycan-binding domain-containing protein [Ekhidna sp.]